MTIIIGKKYGNLTAIEECGCDKNRFKFYKFRCDCGNYTIKRGTNVEHSKNANCGCITIPRIVNGTAFGRLTVKKFNGVINGRENYLCKCECGKEVCVDGHLLKSGNNKSCGCLKIDKLIDRSTTHNKCHSRLYSIFKGMKKRCLKPNSINYNNYGGKGISICQEWLNNFESFYNWAIKNGYKNNLTIDRIDSNKNYCPNNCRWVTQKQQCRNTSRNHFIEYKNKKITIAEFSETTNIPYNYCNYRFNKNMTSEEIIEEYRCKNDKI